MITETTEKPLKEFCSVCDRVAWGDIVRTGNGHWRHADCYGGSKSWIENYWRLKNPTDVQKLLYRVKTEPLSEPETESV